MNHNAIILKNVTKNFKIQKRDTFQITNNLNSNQHTNNFTALDDISFQVQKGEILGIIGFNGGGKTTLLRIISGIYTPDFGEVQVNGKLAPLLQIGTGFHNELNANENIVITGMLLGIPKEKIKEKINKIIEFAELEQFSDMKLKHYSSGMRARLGFSTALELDPDILLVDEILSVGDTAFKEKSQKAFLSFKNKGKTILFATHNLSMLPKLCDRVLLLHNAKVFYIGDPEAAVKKYRELVQNKKQV